MSNELLTVLARFHREVILPDIERVVAGLVNHRFDAIDGHFDSIYQRFERLETEYAAITAGLGRVEERLERVEQRLDALEGEYRDLVATVRRLDERLSRVEKHLEELMDAERAHALRSEVLELRARLDGLQAQVDALERRGDRSS